MDALLREIQDPEVVRWLSIELPYTRNDAVRFVGAAAARWRERREAHFVIAAAGDGRFLGYIGVLPVEAARQVVELVYWVAAAARGRGVATAAVVSVLPWVEATFAPDTIELGMVDGNEGSARVAERAGFRLAEIRSGAATLDGAVADERIYVRDGAAGGA